MDRYGRHAADSYHPSLVEWMFFLSHDVKTGKRLFSDEVIGVGLAAAAILQLCIKDAVVVKDTGAVVRVTSYAMEGDEPSTYVLDQVAALEPAEETAMFWISELQYALYSGVATVLAAAGRGRTESPVMGRARFVTTDPLESNRPTSWAYGLLRSPNAAYADVPIEQRLVAALAGTLGMVTRLTGLGKAEVDANLPRLVDRCRLQESRVLKAAGLVADKIAMSVRR